MRQSNKCGSVRNDEITLVIWCRASSQHPQPSASLLIPSAQKINQAKTKSLTKSCTHWEKIHLKWLKCKDLLKEIYPKIFI